MVDTLPPPPALPPNPTPRQIRFAAALDSIQQSVYRRLGRIEDRVVRLVQSMADDLMRQLDRFDADSFSMLQVAQLEDQLRRAIAGLTEDVSRRIILPAIETAAASGVAAGSIPFARMGVDIPLVRISQNLVNAGARITTTLISNVANVQLGKISNILRRHALGVLSRAQARSLLMSALPGAGPFGSLAARARTILRTEILRTYSITNEQQLGEVGRVFPDAEKRWIHVNPALQAFPRANHVRFSGTRVPIGDPFVISGVTLRFPRDPLGPAKETINCMCFVQALPPGDDVLDKLGLIQGENEFLTAPGIMPRVRGTRAKQARIVRPPRTATRRTVTSPKDQLTP